MYLPISSLHERSSNFMVSTKSPRLGASFALTQRHPNMQQMTPTQCQKNVHSHNISHQFRHPQDISSRGK
jgi:hypothetical protein